MSSNTSLVDGTTKQPREPQALLSTLLDRLLDRAPRDVLRNVLDELVYGEFDLALFELLLAHTPSHELRDVVGELTDEDLAVPAKDLLACYRGERWTAERILAQILSERERRNEDGEPS